MGHRDYDTIVHKRKLVPELTQGGARNATVCPLLTAIPFPNPTILLLYHIISVNTPAVHGLEELFSAVLGLRKVPQAHSQYVCVLQELGWKST
jgi:hypothetical protein